VRGPKEPLRAMLEAIATLERHLQRGRAAFEQDELRHGWFVRNLQIVGEAARAFPGDVRPHTGCQMARDHWCVERARARLFDIDTDVAWDAACGDALVLKPRIEELLRRLKEWGRGVLASRPANNDLRHQSTAAGTIEELKAESATLKHLKVPAPAVQRCGEERKWRELKNELSSAKEPNNG
jgi:uncharacterized protein with HEPN domain